MAANREDFVMGLAEKRIFVLVREFIRLELCFKSADLIAHLSLFMAKLVDGQLAYTCFEFLAGLICRCFDTT